MACHDCYCGRKELEAAGSKITTTAPCGPGTLNDIVDAYENGDIDKSTFIRSLEAAIGKQE